MSSTKSKPDFLSSNFFSSIRNKTCNQYPLPPKNSKHAPKPIKNTTTIESNYLKVKNNEQQKTTHNTHKANSDLHSTNLPNTIDKESDCKNENIIINQSNGPYCNSQIQQNKRQQLHKNQKSDQLNSVKHNHKNLANNNQFDNFVYTLNYSIKNEKFKKIVEKKTDDEETHEVLDQDVDESELDLDIGSQSIINEFNLLVGI